MGGVVFWQIEFNNFAPKVAFCYVDKVWLVGWIFNNSENERCEVVGAGKEIFYDFVAAFTEEVVVDIKCDKVITFGRERS